MADVFLLLIAFIACVAGAFALIYVRVAAGRQAARRLRAARKTALADQKASEEYIQKVNNATTVEELERLAEEREEKLWACSSSPSSSPSSA